MQENEIRTFSNTMYKNKVKMKQRPKQKVTRYKLLEEHKSRTLFDINHSTIFLDHSPREMRIKTKMNKWDVIKLKSFCTAKEIINNAKRQPS